MTSQVHEAWRTYLTQCEVQMWATLLEKNHHGKHVHEVRCHFFYYVVLHFYFIRDSHHLMRTF